MDLPMARIDESAKGSDGFLSRMAINDNKAGMEGLDKEKINKIIMDSTKGSRFYENELKKDQQVNQRIEKLMQQRKQLTEQQLMKATLQVDKLACGLEKGRDLSHTVVHIDMDAFYAAVEMRDNPDLKDKPMAVGSMSMLSTSNYLARKYGVRAAMPGFIGKKLCPNLVIVPPNFDKYRAVSKEAAPSTGNGGDQPVKGITQKEKEGGTAAGNVYSVFRSYQKMERVRSDEREENPRFEQFKTA